LERSANRKLGFLRRCTAKPTKLWLAGQPADVLPERANSPAS